LTGMEFALDGFSSLSKTRNSAQDSLSKGMDFALDGFSSMSKVSSALPSVTFETESFKPVIVGSEWYNSQVAAGLATFTEIATRAAEAPPPLTHAKTTWKAQANSAPEKHYERRRTFNKNAAGLPPPRCITDLP